MNAPNAPKAPSAPSTVNSPVPFAQAKAAAAAKRGKRVLVYGDAGVGKSTLFTKLNTKTLYIDLEGTLPDLFDEIPAHITACYPADWETLMKYLGSDKIANYGAVVVDSLTTLEGMWLEYVLTHARKAPEGYGMVNFSDKPLPRLKDERELGGGGADSARFSCWEVFEGMMNQIVARGTHFISLCHVVDEKKDDASEGLNVTHAPRLQNPNNTTGKNSIRKRAIEVNGEVWYMKWETVRKDDTHVTKTGKRIILGQPNEENAADFDGVESKSRRGFSKEYITDFDVNAVLGVK